MNRQPTSIHPDAALRLLREGNRRFIAGTSLGIEDVEGDDRLDAFSDRQEPFAAVLGCSDSRVPVEMVFGQGPGRLFVVRVAGNVVAPTQLGSLEFAVVELGVRLIVVLGHSKCGAVAATLGGSASGDSHQTGHFGAITKRISRAVFASPEAEDDARQPEWEEAVALNVLQSCEDLRVESPILAELLRSGALRVVGAVYDVESRRVELVDDTRPSPTAVRGASAGS